MTDAYQYAQLFYIEMGSYKLSLPTLARSHDPLDFILESNLG
jgi:hypothetical protein